LPPSEAGAVQVTVAWALPLVAVTPVGAPGAVAGAPGVTVLEGAELPPVPAALVAETMKAKVVPFVSPVTVALVPVPGSVVVIGGFGGAPFTRALTVKLVMALPPFDAGGVKLTVAWELPAVTPVMVGVPGAVIKAAPGELGVGVIGCAAGVAGGHARTRLSP